jgi:hypothetical protein
MFYLVAILLFCLIGGYVWARLRGSGARHPVEYVGWMALIVGVATACCFAGVVFGLLHVPDSLAYLVIAALPLSGLMCMTGALLVIVGRASHRLPPGQQDVPQVGLGTKPTELPKSKSPDTDSRDRDPGAS